MTTSGSAATLVGPRIVRLPERTAHNDGDDAAALAESCGLVCDGWQRRLLVDAMGERADGLWAADEVVCICSRQNGKNVAVEVRELYGVTVLHENIIHTAHLFKTTRESFDRLAGMVEANPKVRDLMTKSLASQGVGWEMRFRGGGRIQFIARSRTSGRGLSGDLLVFDEFQEMNDDAQGALMPVVSARPNPQVWYLGSAPGPASLVAHRLRRRGRQGGEGRLAYFEYSAPPGSDPDDEDVWRQGNPGYPERISRETILRERRSMSDEMFLRERLSISPDLVDDEGVFPAAAWAACQDPDLEVTADLFGVDVNPDRTYAAIVAAGTAGVEVVDYRPGTDWLLERAQTLGKYRRPFVIDQQGPAGNLIATLERAGLKVHGLTGEQMVKAAGDFYDRVVARNIRVRANLDLDRAVAGAAKRPVGDAFAWGRKNSDCDVSLLVAASAAAWRQSHRRPVGVFFAQGDERQRFSNSAE